MLIRALLCLNLCIIYGDTVLESFSNPTHTWHEQNDPVMGGRSTGNFTIKNGIGYFVGHVAIVPSLKAPGFIRTESVDKTPFPDVRSCSALSITVRAKGNFTGYRVSFGTKQPPIHKFFAYGFKAHFNAPTGEDFTTVELPFVNFSDYWDDATGEQIKTCQDNVIYCPDQKTLKDMETISFWAEGVEGDVHIEIKSVAATHCKGEDISIIGGELLENDQKLKEDTTALETFSNPAHTWREKNDPVMGGKSTGNFTIKNGIGYFVGRVVNVPFLQAPGFITTQSMDKTPFPDVRSCNALAITARSKVDYTGYRVSFGTKQPPIHKRHAYGYKAHFNAPTGEAFTTVEIPFANFSDYWDDATGEQIKTCQDNVIYCPDQETLKDMKTITIWGEGVGGDVHLEIKSISATGCKGGVLSIIGGKSMVSDQKLKQDTTGDTALETFANPAHTWRELNDPVMGGRSTGNFTIKNSIGYFVGYVAIVPSLKAPGFITTQSVDKKPFPDVRSCNALAITARTKGDYSGYRVSFGTKRPPIHKRHAYGYKAPFNAPTGEEFTTVEIPFLNFSDYWDDATGELIKKCQDNVIYCPDEETLKDMKTITIWAEGVEGNVNLEIKSVAATGCKGGVLSIIGGKSLENDQKLKQDTAEDTVLETFANPAHTWRETNDPVMGGRSTGNFTIKDGVGYFVGHVAIVPSLKAPGFIKTETVDKKHFPDVRSCSALSITARAKGDYTGYRVSFGTKQPPVHKFFAYGFKAHFNAPTGEEFTTVEIPFVNFSDYWDDATGEQIKTCQDNVIYCPDEQTLKDMKTISFWGEGVEGDVYLEIKSVAATGCKDENINLVNYKYNSTCTKPIQDNLRYNLTDTNAVEDFPFPLEKGETLADAVCCDYVFKPYAEPQGTYARDDVALFSKINPNGTTTFYDSACGIPLFKAPVGRSFADFKEDTTEHGWPSFRSEELIKGNSKIIKETGEVVSKCGTHLGSYLPDEKGSRWCLDLACLSGNPIKYY